MEIAELLRQIHSDLATIGGVLIALFLFQCFRFFVGR